MARLDIKTACLAVAKAGKVDFDHDRSQTVGASEIGRCIKAVAAKKQGVEPDAEHVDDPGFAVRGNIIEDQWAVPVLRASIEAVGGKLEWAGQAQQTTVEWTKKHASCTPDGVFTGVPRDWLAGLGVKKCSPEVLSEVKSISEFIHAELLPKPGHPEQAHYGMGLVRAATDYQPEFALLTYWNCSQLTRNWPLVIPFNADYFAKQLARAKRCITTPWKKLPAEGKIRGGKECKYCEFQLSCTGKRSTRAPDTRVPKSNVINLSC